MNNLELVPNNWETRTATIRVVGVGGAGCNAVDYMFEQKIEGCEFFVCNTDSQALQNCSVNNKIQLGHGLGAGCDPLMGHKAAVDSSEEIENKLFSGKIDMLFITAGLGGGTGTGAAPVIANMAKERNILTVAVVTLPFSHEGNDSYVKAMDGLSSIEENVDSLILIDNDKLYKEYPEEQSYAAFKKTDIILCTAVKSIIEIIKKRGYINVDMKDVDKMMRKSGMGIMGYGEATGEDRIEKAVEAAFSFPLMSGYDMKTAQNVLLNITCGKDQGGLLMKDHTEIDKLVTQYIGNANRFKKGLVFDESDNDMISITAIATGFMVEREKLRDCSEENLININSKYKYSRKNTHSINAPKEINVALNNNSLKIFPFMSDENYECEILKDNANIQSLKAETAIHRRISK